MATATQTLTLSALADELQGQANRLRSLSLKELMGGDVLEKVREGIAENFDQARSPDGKPWAPRKGAYPWPILVKTGEMKASMCDAGGNGYVIVEDTALTVGSQDEKYRFHEDGTSRMAARPSAGLTDQREEELGEIIADGILDKVLGDG